MSPLANGGRPKKRERMRGINGEECGILEKVGILERILEFGKSICLGEEGKEKEKNLLNEDIFLVLENENIGNTDS